MRITYLLKKSMIENIIHRPLMSNIDYIVLTFSIKDPNFDILQFQKNLYTYIKITETYTYSYKD